MEIGGGRGSFGATEESTATGVWAGEGWELRLRLRRSDPRERTGVGCVNTA